MNRLIAISFVALGLMAIARIPAHADPPATPITNCMEIKQSGTYAMTSDIASAPGSCLNIHDAQNIVINCNSHSITSSNANTLVNVNNVSGISFTGCTFVLTGYENSFVMTVNNSQAFSYTSGSIRNDSAASPNSARMALSVGGITNLTLSGNTIRGMVLASGVNGGTISQNIISDDGLYLNAGRNVVISQNTVKGPTTQVAEYGLSSYGGSNNQITNNIVLGGWNGQGPDFHNEYNDVGFDDGINVGVNETGTLIANNTLSDNWDAGIETEGLVSNLTIRNNSITNSATCAIGSWIYTSWQGNVVSGNTASRTPELFEFHIESDPSVPRPSAFYFQNNTFSNNVLESVLYPGRFRIGAASNFDLGTLTALAAANNTLTGNNFGPSLSPAYFNPASMIVDGGGNICQEATPSGYPLACYSSCTQDNQCAAGQFCTMTNFCDALPAGISFSSPVNGTPTSAGQGLYVSAAAQGGDLSQVSLAITDNFSTICQGQGSICATQNSSLINPNPAAAISPYVVPTSLAGSSLNLTAMAYVQDVDPSYNSTNHRRTVLTQVIAKPVCTAGQVLKNGACALPVTSNSQAIGVVDWGAAYQITSDPKIVEGARFIHSLGAKNITIAMSPNLSGNYPSENFGNPSPTTLTQLAQTADYQTVLNMPFQTYVLEAFAFSDYPNYLAIPNPNLPADTQEIANLVTYLLTTFQGTGKTFIIKNWEGDNAMAGNTALEPAMLQWLNARHNGVIQGRAAAGAVTGVTVHDAAEFNLISPVKANPTQPCMLKDIIPYVNSDMISYSSYDTTNNPLTDSLYSAITSDVALIRSMIPVGKPLMIGEFGYVANVGSPPFYYPDPGVREQTANLAFLDAGASPVFTWVIEDGQVSDKGMGLVEPSGAYSPMWTALQVLTGAPVNQRPTVNAGSAQSITLPASAQLQGSANDDGLPYPPGHLTYVWSKVSYTGSGAGLVTFNSSTALQTTASFSDPGTYALQLSANDTQLTGTAALVITVLPVPVSAVSATPSSGSGSSQTFQFLYNDTFGAGDLSTAWMWFTPQYNPAALVSANTCLLYYNNATNQLSLLNDAATSWGTPMTVGTASALQNSQCSVNVANVSVTPNGTALTVSLPVTFKPGFAGTQQILSYVNNSAINSGWQKMGSWTVPALAVSALSTTPSSGSGPSQTFQFQYSDTFGASDLSTAWMWFTPQYNPAAPVSANTCLLYYNNATNQLSLVNDAATSWGTPMTVGKAGALQNSQCSVNVANVSVTPNGNALTVSLPVAFKPGFAGTQQIWSYVNNSVINSGWQPMGSWTVPNGLITIWPASAAPINPYQNDLNPYELGIKFTSDKGGYISALRFYKHVQNTGTHIGNLWDSSGHNLTQVTFTNETTSGWQQMNFTPPVAITANTLYVASYHTSSGYAWDGAYFTSSGVDNNPLHAPMSSSVGGNGVYAAGSTSIFPTASSNSNYWVDVVFSSYPITAPAPAVTAVSAAPSSGSGAGQTFQFQYSDTSGARDIATTWMWFTPQYNPAAPVSANTCMLYYNNATNQLNFLNDASTAWTPWTVGTSTVSLQNSQCSVNVAGVSVTPNGNTLTISLPVTFKPGFAGTQQIWSYVSGTLNNVTSGWHQMGSWAVPPLQITSSLSQSLQVGQPFGYQITATNNPTGYYVSSVLPTGLSFNSSTGLISGTPTQSSVWYVFLGATYANGSYAAATVQMAVTGLSSSNSIASQNLLTAIPSPRVYPNPWRGARGDSNITFDQMPFGSTVKIFTVSGRWVTTLSAPAGSVSWTLTNDSGNRVASGIYLYLITDGQGDKIRGKFTIIK